jgi:hypothetical protein
MHGNKTSIKQLGYFYVKLPHDFAKGNYAVPLQGGRRVVGAFLYRRVYGQK